MRRLGLNTYYAYTLMSSMIVRCATGTVHVGLPVLGRAPDRGVAGDIKGKGPCLTFDLWQVLSNL